MLKCSFDEDTGHFAIAMTDQSTSPKLCSIGLCLSIPKFDIVCFCAAPLLFSFRDGKGCKPVALSIVRSSPARSSSVLSSHAPHSSHRLSRRCARQPGPPCRPLRRTGSGRRHQQHFRARAAAEKRERARPELQSTRETDSTSPRSLVAVFVSVQCALWHPSARSASPLADGQHLPRTNHPSSSDRHACSRAARR